jgi:hypothetical protein
MGADNAEVLKAITTLTEKVEQYHGDFREFRGTYVEKVSVLEESAKNEKFWRKVQMICVVPVTGGIHQLAQYLHWIK